MNALLDFTVPPHLVAELALHLRNSGSKLSVMHAATEAIRAWITAKTPQPAPAPADPATSRGYRWKSLFLPSGTELRMSTRLSTYYGRVDGDDIVYQGRRVSPRGMTLAIAGEGRNAWRDLWLKFPGERYWKQAIRCRSDQERSIQIQNAADAAVPGAAVAAAAVTMSDTVKTLLELMVRLTARPVQTDERRVVPGRRTDDILAGDCAFD